MIKLTKHDDFKSLKLESTSIKTIDNKLIEQMSEWEEFLLLLQKKLLKSRKIKDINR